MNPQLVINRLAIIKQLYKIGLKQSEAFEPVSSFSILSLHDSVEMFLKLASENKNIPSSKLSFMEYWEKIPDLTLKESLKNLNERRVNIKHKGLLPSKSDIEISRINTTDFFEQNTIIQFGIEFKNISLLTLLNYLPVKTSLENAQNALDAGDFQLSIQNSAIAFSELLDEYQEDKQHHQYDSPFKFAESFSFLSSFNMDLKDRKMSEFVDKVGKSIENISDAIKILSFGIDYKQYIKFQILTPRITKTMGGKRVLEVYRKKKWSSDNCQYCIDFVLESAMNLQQFDYSINELEETPYYSRPDNLI